MKKIYSKTRFILLIFSLLLCINAYSAKWTVMVYMAADNDLETAALDDFIEMAIVGSTADFDIVVQLDRSTGYSTNYGDWTTCKRFHITQGMTPIVGNEVSDIGEPNMGDPEILVDFCKWTHDNYPADNYFLILWDHGEGWRARGIKRAVGDDNTGDKAVCYDFDGPADTDDTTMSQYYLNFCNGDIQGAFAEIITYAGVGKWAGVGYDACLVGMWENMVASEPYFDFFVASERPEWNDGWSYWYFLEKLDQASGNLTAKQLSDYIVEAYENGDDGNNAPDPSNTGYTLASVDLSLLPAFNSTINTLAQELMCARESGYGVEINNIRAATYEMHTSYPWYNQIDLYDLTLNIGISNLPMSVKNAAIDVQTAYIAAVSRNFVRSDHPDCHGTAIYYQYPTDPYDTLYDGTDVAPITFWNNFLRGDGCPVPLLITFRSRTIDDSVGGNNNSFIDPGETVKMDITMSNMGTDGATNVSAVLSTTDTYVTMIQNSSTYPNIASNGSETSNSSYEFSIDGGCPLGHQIEFVLSISADTGYTNTNEFTEMVGKIVPSSMDTPIPITDKNTIISTINISEFCDIADILVSVDISHTYIMDLIIKLVSPTGTAVYLHNRTGGGDDDIITTYDNITIPDGPGVMDDFNGEKTWGIWELHIYDAAIGDEGTLNSWSLEIEPCNCSDPYPIVVYNSHSIDDSAENDNGVAQPGENIIMPITLQNEGYADATGVNATLSTLDSNVTITQNYSTYPDIPFSNTGISETNFAFLVDSGCPIGHEITFTLDINADSGYTNQINFTVVVSEFIVSSADTPINIPAWDAVGIESIINVPYSCNIVDIFVSVDIAHNYTGDLVVELTSPTGTIVRLHDRSGGTVDDIYTIYDSTTVPDGPGSMPDFDGENSIGEWKLHVSDHDSWATIGTLNSWSVILHLDTCTQPLPEIVYDSHAIDDSTGGNNNGIAESGEQIDMSVTLRNIWYGEATNISAVLSTGCTYITFSDDTASYLDLSFDETSECLTPYQFDVYSGLPMDYEVTFDLNITSDEGTWSDTFIVTINPSGTGCDWYVSTDTPIAIPDSEPAGITSIINITEHIDILEINCLVDITHTYKGDLIVELTSPLNTIVRLHNKTGFGDDDIYTVYDSTTAPSGPGTMDDFIGEDAFGNWELFVSDTGGGDTGTLNEWQLEICSNAQSDIDLDSASAGAGIFHPEWSWKNSPRKIAYIHRDSGGISNIRVINDDGSGMITITNSLDIVSHLSQISWTPDDNYVVFTSTASYGQLHIRKIKADGTEAGNSSLFQPSLIYWRCIDPDYGDKLNQFNEKERIITSISGDIWVYEPNNTIDPDSGLKRITHLSDPYLDLSQTDKLLQPHWNGDNTEIVFVRRPACIDNEVADTNIWKAVDIQDIISGLSNPIGDPDGDGTGGDWGDTRLISIGTTTHPEYSPSFSINGSKIAYNCDVLDSFNNCNFRFDPISEVSNSNFDVYINNNPQSGYCETINEGFLKWSSGGGDRFAFINENAGLFSLKTVYDETVGGFLKGNFRIDGDYLIIEDSSRTKLSIPLDIASHYPEFSIQSVSHIDSNKSNLIPIGEFRRVSIPGEVDEVNFPKKLTLRIYYTYEEVMDYSEEQLELRRYTDGKWEYVDSYCVDDIDGNPDNDKYDGGFIIAGIEGIGNYGIFVNTNKTVSKNYDADLLRLYPNPCTSANGDSFVIMDHFGDIENIEDITIYTIFGEIVATYRNAVKHYNDGNDFLRWDLENDSGFSVASGIYIIIITPASGKSVVKKVAVIK
ncbi:proprotein convertase P-domain-containing protein [bacterium]|nr:proprotein convertase P-domain-containing protein [bacterium]